MELNHEENWSMRELLNGNLHTFEDELLSEAIHVKDKIDEILLIGNIDLLKNARKLVLFIIDNNEEDLIHFAKQEGIAWAKFSLTLAFKLEWVHAIRRTLWKFLEAFELKIGKTKDHDNFFALEKNINDYIDHFLMYFFISYSKYKDELIEKQRELVKDLSVPIIPIKDDIRILPIIGSVDSDRMTYIQERILEEIGRKRIRILIIDLSGIAPMKEREIHDFRKIIEANTLMGCQTIITGLRSDIVKNIVASGIDLMEIAAFKGTLELALNDVVFQHKRESKGKPY